jgi:hypothetical protein
VLPGLLAILTLANVVLLKLKPGDVVQEVSGVIGEVCVGMCGFGIEHQELETREKRFWPSESAIGHIEFVNVNARSSLGCVYRSAVSSLEWDKAKNGDKTGTVFLSGI